MLESLFGESREKVRAIFGPPARIGSNFDNFAEHGLLFEYGLAGQVTDITAGLMEGGVEHGGSILGIRIEDELEKCRRLWGEPIFEEKPIPPDEEDKPWEYRKVTWHRQGYQLQLEIWNENGHDRVFKSWTKDTVKCISISLTWICAACGKINTNKWARCQGCHLDRI